MARFARLYPLYAVFLIADIAIKTTPTGLQFWELLPYFLTLTQSWVPFNFGETHLSGVFSGGAWSISSEVFLYLLYIPMAIVLLHRLSTKGLIAAIAIAAAVWLAGVYYNKWSGWFVYMSPYWRFFEFLAGVFAAKLVIWRGVNFTRRPTARDTAILCIGLGSLAVPMLLYSTTAINTIVLVGGFAPGLAMTIWYSATFTSPLSWLLSTRLFIAGGTASYSLYMIHGWILPMFSPPVVGGQLYMRLAVVWTIDLILAMGMYAVIEAPARRFLRRALRRDLRFLSYVRHE